MVKLVEDAGAYKIVTVSMEYAQSEVPGPGGHESLRRAKQSG